MIRSFFRRLLQLAGVIVALVVILLGGTALWRHYMLAPWTRDARVRVETVIVAPEVHGVVAEVRVRDNQRVAKGDVLFTIEKTDYEIARDEARAALDGAVAAEKLAEFKSAARKKLTELSVSQEDRQNFDSAASIASASTLAAKARLVRAERDLARTEVRSLVNGYIVNLRLRVGDYASEGKAAVAVVDSDSFWLAGYFEETQLTNVRPGQLVEYTLMAYPGRVLKGRVESLSSGVADQNATSAADLPTVNPVFTWVRLAARIPVRIAIDPPPEDILLAAGLTATVTVGQPTTLAQDVDYGWRYWAPAAVFSNAKALWRQPAGLFAPRGAEGAKAK